MLTDGCQKAAQEARVLEALHAPQQTPWSAVFSGASPGPLVVLWGHWVLPPLGASVCFLFLHALQKAENGWKDSATGYWTVYSWPGQD